LADFVQFKRMSGGLRGPGPLGPSCLRYWRSSLKCDETFQQISYFQAII